MGNSFSELIVYIRGHVQHAWYIVGQSTITKVARCEYLRLHPITLNICIMYFSETFYSNNNNNKYKRAYIVTCSRKRALSAAHNISFNIRFAVALKS
jgi:hypothetical protein